MRPRLRYLSTMLFAVALACASSGTSAATPRRSTTTISGEEIASTGVSTVYDAIQRLRPQWLTSSRMRGSGTSDALQVYLDMNRFGTMEALRQLPVGGISEVRYLSAAEATNRYGTGHSGGVILILMNKQ